MDDLLRRKLLIPYTRIDEINAIFLDTNSQVINDFLRVVSKYGSPEDINRKARDASQLSELMRKVETIKPEYINDLEWLQQQRDNNVFISIDEYRQQVLGANYSAKSFNEDFAVTLEVSATQYFPWIISAAKRATERRTLMPARYIKV